MDIGDDKFSVAARKELALTVGAEPGTTAFSFVDLQSVEDLLLLVNLDLESTPKIVDRIRQLF